MNFYRRQKSVREPASVVEQSPISVFKDEQSLSATPIVEQDVVDVESTVLGSNRDDAAPFGPELADHIVAPAERTRRRIRMGGSAENVEPETARSPELARTQDGQSMEAAPVANESAAPAAEKMTLRQRLAARTAKVSRAPSSIPGAVEDAGVRIEPLDAQATATAPTKQPEESLKAKVSRLRGKSGKPVRVSLNVPVRVLIGFLPEVTERDALSYALGIADKHVENIENAHYDVFPHQAGFVYEVHEGGTGAAFVPSILEYFESLGPFRSEVDARMHIRTATRTVEVIRKPSQIEAVLLPESAGHQSTPEPRAGAALRPAMNKRTGLLVAGAVVFITGFFAAIVIGSFMRLVPTEEVRQPPPERFNIQDLPVGQWATLQGVPEGKYVKALRFNKQAKWHTEKADVETQAPAAPQPAQPVN